MKDGDSKDTGLPNKHPLIISAKKTMKDSDSKDTGLPNKQPLIISAKIPL